MSKQEQFKVVSYWSGNLPEITFLHFLSFRIHHPNTSYTLFAETQEGFAFSISEEMKSKLHLLGIGIEYVNLNDLLESICIRKFWTGQKRLFNKLIGKFFILISRIFKYFRSKSAQKKNYQIFNFHYSLLRGWDPPHFIPFSNIGENLAFRSDVFRTAIQYQLIDCSVLYCDLDICFLRELPLNDWPNGAIAQWGQEDFGNSGLLYLPISNTAGRQAIYENLKRGIPALPWHMFSAERCNEYGLEIIPNHLIDPAWSSQSLIHGEVTLFMRNGDHVDSFMEELLDCIGIHWHNQWSSVPEQDSPYNKLLRNFFLTMENRSA